MGDWSDYAKGYEEKVFSLTSVPQRRKQITDLLVRGRTLNMGCGSVHYLNQDLVEQGHEVVAGDNCLEMLAASSARYTDHALEHKYVDSREMPFEDGHFENVVSVNSILPPEREDADRMFSEAGRVLRPGGRFAAFLVAYSNPKRLDKLLGLGLTFDDAQKRMYDTGEWQCYHDTDTIIRNMRESGFWAYDIKKVWLKTNNEIEQLSRIYGYDASKHHSFEWLLFAVK